LFSFTDASTIGGVGITGEMGASTTGDCADSEITGVEADKLVCTLGED
jgi:hypothetical protein